MDESDGGDRNDQFHRNEAISAVADEGFLGEEDDDYEDLYNDVNVGEGFLQSLRSNEDMGGFRNGEEDRKIESVVESRGVLIPGVEGPTGGCGGGGGAAAVGDGKVKIEQDEIAPGSVFGGPTRLERFQNLAGKVKIEQGEDAPGSVFGGPARLESFQNLAGKVKIEQNVEDSGSVFGGPARLESFQNLGGKVKIEQDVDAPRSVFGGPAKLESFQNLGFTGNDLASKGSGPVSAGGGGMRVDLGPSSGKMGETEGKHINNSVPSQGMTQHSQTVGFGNVANESYVRQQGGGGGGVGGNVNASGGFGSSSGGGGTILFVGDLHWWTTDAELEAELSKYGVVKEVKFFDEKASGKSKGYCQVEFYDNAAATACKEGMNGHVFNGRSCLVAYASPHTVRRMGEAQVNKNQQMSQASFAPGRRGAGEAGGRSGGNAITTGGNYQGGGNYQSGDGSRNYGRGNWGRGAAQGMGNRGQVGPMRNRIGGMGGRGIIGNGFGQGLATNPQLLHPQSMMNQGFDPGYGAHMGRMGGYGGFPAAPTAPFSGILPSFPQVGGVGLHGVAPHVNPAFFGRGMPTNGMGMMPTTVVEGHGMGMWSDPNAAGWVGDEHGGRAGESSYGDDAASDHQYGEGSLERGGWPNAMKEKERPFERDWSGASDRRYRDDREPGSDRDIPRDKDMGHGHDWSERRHRDDRETGRDRDRDRDRDREHDRDRERERDRERDRDRYRDDRDRYLDHPRYRDRESEHDDEWDRGRSSRTHSKSQLSQEEDQRSRSRDAEYGKRRRLPSE